MAMNTIVMYSHLRILLVSNRSFSDLGPSVAGLKSAEERLKLGALDDPIPRRPNL